MIELLNINCMDYMATQPDNAFDLAIVDPPYGIGIDGQKENIKGKKSDRKHHERKNWDKSIPSSAYFDELRRVSVHQIIFGANYFVQHLISGHKGWIIWDKCQPGLTMSDCEIAFSNFDRATRIWRKNRGILNQEGTIHPTQKPVKLYEWLLSNYAKEGDRILDTHGGSMSSAIACHNMGFDMTICEIDKDYFEAGKERYENHIKQLRMF